MQGVGIARWTISWISKAQSNVNWITLNRKSAKFFYFILESCQKFGNHLFSLQDLVGLTVLANCVSCVEAVSTGHHKYAQMYLHIRWTTFQTYVSEMPLSLSDGCSEWFCCNFKKIWNLMQIQKEENWVVDTRKRRKNKGKTERKWRVQIFPSLCLKITYFHLFRSRYHMKCTAQKMPPSRCLSSVLTTNAPLHLTTVRIAIWSAINGTLREIQWFMFHDLVFKPELVIIAPILLSMLSIDRWTLPRTHPNILSKRIAHCE